MRERSYSVLYIRTLFSIFLASAIFLLSIAPTQAKPRENQLSSDSALLEKEAALAGPSSSTIDIATSAIVQEIILHSMSLIGVRYRWGGNTPEHGLDCSGFIRYVFEKAATLSLPRTSRSISQVGQVVDKEDLQPGDLVFFNTLRRQFSHVGVYLGGNQFIHAPSKGKTIAISKFDHAYWASRYNGARRVNHDTIHQHHFLPEPPNIKKKKARTSPSTKKKSRPTPQSNQPKKTPTV